jgi:hypothetical protein
MSSSYPGSLDAFATNRTAGQTIQASTDNDHSDAINKIEAELGTNPSGTESTVTARAAVLESQGINVKAAPYSATGDGSTNDTAAIQAAIDAVPSSGGTIYFPRGSYVCNGALSLNGRKSIRLVGMTPSIGAGAAGTALIYTATGTTPFLTMKDTGGASCEGIVVENMSLVYTSGSFTGHLIDARGTPPLDTANCTFRNCFIGSQPTSTRTAASLVRLLGSHTMAFEGCTFFGAVNYVWGQETGSGSSANGISFRTCLFQNGAHDFQIRNPGSSWTFQGCSFEPNPTGGIAAGEARSIYTESMTIFSTGLAVVGCWFGDDTANNGDWIRLRGHGTSIIGNTFASGAQTQCISVASNDIRGLTVTGNYFATASGGVSAAVAYGATTGHQYVLVAANHYVNCAETTGTVVPSAASALSFTPNGSISATNVQSAIQEVRDEAGTGSGNVDSNVFNGTSWPARPSATTVLWIGGGSGDDPSADMDDGDLWFPSEA